MPWKDVLEALSAIRVLCPAPLPLSVETHEAALRIAAKYRYHIYDALVIAAALESACATLYSEDLHDGHDRPPRHPKPLQAASVGRVSAPLRNQKEPGYPWPTLRRGKGGAYPCTLYSNV